MPQDAPGPVLDGEISFGYVQRHNARWRISVRRGGGGGAAINMNSAMLYRQCILFVLVLMTAWSVANDRVEVDQRTTTGANRPIKSPVANSAVRAAHVGTSFEESNFLAEGEG